MKKLLSTYVSLFRVFSPLFSGCATVTGGIIGHIVNKSSPDYSIIHPEELEDVKWGATLRITQRNNSSFPGKYITTTLATDEDGKLLQPAIKIVSFKLDFSEVPFSIKLNTIATIEKR